MREFHFANINYAVGAVDEQVDLSALRRFGAVFPPRARICCYSADSQLLFNLFEMLNTYRLETETLPRSHSRCCKIVGPIMIVFRIVAANEFKIKKQIII